ncbi:hypothetical protein G4Z16_19955 [Streptomyces bathyalis]|uniref:Uncharacterized protein n=1 Tax=Streptomyces bathyalis TaxID=2710756 RepID=A0A7T1WTL1_9ACTN|nr:hypothetical protein [Streptomyces bathyalis]QPP08292.1 hypothetical protein G4Z16_19955 [Streptomyces bathyalis]
MDPITTARRGRATPFAILVALTVLAAACTTGALVQAERHLLAACEGSPVPWSHFALAYAGFGAAALAVLLHVLGRRRVRGSDGARVAAPTGRAGRVTAVASGVVLLAGALALFSDHQQASMAKEANSGNVLVVCTSG